MYTVSDLLFLECVSHGTQGTCNGKFSHSARATQMEFLPPTPPPTPLHWKQRLCSVATVSATATAGQLLIRGLARSMGADAFWTSVRFIADGHTVIAAAALLLINVWDPGIIRRSNAVCSPLPRVVSERLRMTEPLEGLRNIPDEKGISSFCVRCCIWRPIEAHHCSICQRCVNEFDEHCEILGCCVGGSLRGCRGNKLIHRVNIFNLVFACVTAAVALLVTAVQLSLRNVAVGALFIFVFLWPASAILLGVARQRNWQRWLRALFSDQPTGAHKAKIEPPI